MRPEPTKYFILTYRLDTQEVEVEDFGADDETAAAAYSEREHAHRDDPMVEVVMVGADSLETVRKTHSHYFAERDPDGVTEFERELVSMLDRNAA
jgi:hypothetical protein